MNRRRFLGKASNAFAGLGAYGLPGVLQAEPTAAGGRTFYIDTAGDNNHSGLSAAEAWRDFTPVNRSQYGAGDTILLRRGCTWNQELIVQGAGSAERFLTVSAYGSGDRPRIQRNGWPAERCMRLQNAAYVKVSSVEVCNAGAGIVLFYDHSYNNRSVYLDDLVAHDFRSVRRTGDGAMQGPEPKPRNDRVSWAYGIGVTGVEDSANNQTRVLTDFRVTRTEVYNTGAGIALDWGNHFCADGTLALSNKFGDVWMEGLHLHDNTVEGISFVSLFLTSVTGCTIQDCVIERGARFAPTGTAAVQIMYSRNVTLRRVRIADTLRNDCPDNAAVDFECNNDTMLVEDCTFVHNAGPAIEVLATPGNAEPYTRNLTVRNCLFDTNNWARKLTNAQIAVPNWVDGNKPTGVIENNRFRNAPQTTFFGGDGNTTALVLTGNRDIGVPQPEPVVLHSWNFAATRDCMGWCKIPASSIDRLRVGAEGLEGSVTGIDPYFISADDLHLALTAETFVRVTLRNGTKAAFAQIYFLTEANVHFDEGKHRDFWLYPESAGFVTYDLDMPMPGWTGVLKQLRLDPEQGAATGMFTVKAIQILRR